MKAQTGAGFFSKPWGAALSVFILFFLTRDLATPYYELTTDYIWDGMLETCVQPWQLATGQPIAGSDAAYLSHVTNLSVSRTFDYSVHHLQVFIALMAAISMGLVFLAFDRIFGFPVAARIMAVLLVSFPFITWEATASVIPTGLWGQSLVLFCLTLSPSWKRDLALAGSCLIALLCYPSGVIVIMALIPLHVLFFRKQWPRPRLFSFGLFMIVGSLLVLGLRYAISGHADLMSWGAGRVEGIPATGGYLSALGVMLTDIFWGANSWCSGAFGQSYLNILFSLLLLVGIIRLIQLLSEKFLVARYFHRAGAGSHRTGRSFTLNLADQERWLFVCLLTFSGALLIAAIAAGTPGVRRVFSAVLFLIPIITVAPYLRWRSLWLPKLLNLVFLLGVATTAISSVHLIKSLLPPPAPAYRAWFEKGEKIAAEIAKLEQPAIIIIDRDLETAVDRLFCRLYLDNKTRGKAIDFYSVETSKSDGTATLLKNGESTQPGTPSLDLGFVLVTNSQQRAGQLLPELLAKASSGSAALKKVIVITGP